MDACFVLTISDRVTHGQRSDTSGPALAARLEALGFHVTRGLVPDEQRLIAASVRRAAQDHALVVTTGGTGLAPRDVTPQAVREVIDYEVPGFGEQMRAAGRRSTPFADLSRSLAAVCGRTLVLAVPGSERAALESLDAVASLLRHALDTLAGEADSHPPQGSAARDLPPDDGMGSSSEATESSTGLEEIRPAWTEATGAPAAVHAAEIQPRPDEDDSGPDSVGAREADSAGARGADEDTATDTVPLHPPVDRGTT
ncbi:hypothetical protein BH20CHL6_BH20CHL6_16330 [soil metagenome]